MPGEADRRLDAAAKSYLDAIARELASADLPERQRGELLANVRELLTAGASPAAVGAAEDVVSAYAEAADGADGARDPGGSGVWDPASGRLLAPKPRGGGSNLAWGGIAARLGLLRPDDVDPKVATDVSKALSRTIKVGARPLTTAGWTKVFTDAGFEIDWVDHNDMRLVEPSRIIADEGLIGALKFFNNVRRNPAARERILAMRKVFRTHQDHIAAVAMVLRKPNSIQEDK